MPSEPATDTRATPTRPVRVSRRSALRLGAALATVAVVAWLAWQFSLARGLQQLHESAAQRLEVEAARLDGLLARFEYLPTLLETSPAVMQLFETPGDDELTDRVNRYLKALNALAGADNLYVLDARGRALAAADFDSGGTPVGQNLSYRPYFSDALTLGEGRFYGVGITSARAGYYLAYALPAPVAAEAAAASPSPSPSPSPTPSPSPSPSPSRSRVSGVATVKVNLDAVEREWRDLPYRIVLVDEHDVVILASEERWRFHPIVPLAEAALAEAHRARRYGSAKMSPIDWQLRQRTEARAARIVVEKVPMLASEHAVNRNRWRLMLLEDERPVLAAAWRSAGSAALAALVLLLAAALAIQRKRAARQRLASQIALQAAHDSLEAMVLARTAELKAAQHDLVHAGKLAVLGQMSAGMVHELNQPLAALHTLSDNAALLLERGRTHEASTNLVRISQLVGRLGRLTGQLKVFAHKAETRLEPVAVQRVVAESLALLAPRLRAAGIETSIAIEPPGLQVAGEPARLEQVLINLLGNAADALDAVPLRQIDIRVDIDHDMGRITVRNSGPGIDAAILPRLFEPFVTTRPAGKGLGLGLVISAHIIESFHGTLTVVNLAPTGVAFTIRLPLPAGSDLTKRT